RVGREAETAFRFELLDRLHQADIALGDYFPDRQAVAAIAHRDLGDEAEMARYELVCSIRVPVLNVPLGEHVLFLRLEHRKAPDFLKIAGKAAFPGNDAR